MSEIRKKIFMIMMQDVVEYYSPSSCSAFSKAVILNLNLSSLAIDFNLYFILRPLPFKFGEINFHVVEAFSSEYAYLYFIASLSNLTRLGERAPLLLLLLA